MPTPDRPLRILGIGPAPAGPRSRGGMATVTALMLAARDPRVRVRHVATYLDAGVLARLVTGVRGMLLASALVAAGRVDVLHVHLAHGGSVLRKAVPMAVARARHVPVVVHAHSYDFAGWFDAQPAVLRRIVPRLLRSSCWLVLGAPLVGPYRDRLGLPDVRVLRNPVQRPPAVPVRAPAPLVVVALGRLGPRKGSPDLVRALAALPGGFRAVLAGDGDVDDVRVLVARAGLAATVEVRGWITPADRDALLAGAHVFALPSYDEGLPMALLEAMSWGLVPVVTRVGAIPDAITDGVDGLLIEPGDPDALADRLGRLIASPDLVARLGAAARARSAGFDVGPWFAELVELWCGLAR